MQWRLPAAASAASSSVRARALSRPPAEPATQLSSSTMRHVTAHGERRCVELAAHGLRLVVIAGNAQHRQPERAEQAAEVRVAGRVILHDVAGDEQRIRRPVARLRASECRHERRQSSHAAQRPAAIAVEMRVGKVCEAYDGHMKFQRSRPTLKPQ
jgi:hypothetical protein